MFCYFKADACSQVVYHFGNNLLTYTTWLLESAITFDCSDAQLASFCRALGMTMNELVSMRTSSHWQEYIECCHDGFATSKDLIEVLNAVDMMMVHQLYIQCWIHSIPILDDGSRCILNIEKLKSAIVHHIVTNACEVVSDGHTTPQCRKRTSSDISSTQAHLIHASVRKGI